jgi:hypothetical protein
MKKFIKVGFEFTASANAKTDTNSTFFNKKGNEGSFIRWMSQHYGVNINETTKRYKIKDLPKQFSWINENYEYDDCGCEVATPIIDNIYDVTNCYNTFKQFTQRYGFTTDINKALCGLGGCHIHIDLKHLTKSVKIKLLSNIAVFVTNNPQLNWAFNDVNDNTNANSLLNHRGIDNSLEDNCDIMCDNKAVKKYLNDANPYRAFVEKPLHIDLNKVYSIRYNDGYNTIEFRIFDMPNDLTRHLLHYDVAMAIYNYCLKLTMANIKLTSQYDTIREIANIPYKEAIKKLKETMKTIGINYKRVKDLEVNIQTRYDWTMFSYGEVASLSENHCYLL